MSAVLTALALSACTPSLELRDGEAYDEVTEIALSTLSKRLATRLW
ncbi:MAG: hypothetical protein KGS00_05015 [Alphaproteobacteria bacterium]|nr:hypothetical protein [Alphaproteobacteria bacterium]